MKNLALILVGLIIMSLGVWSLSSGIADISNHKTIKHDYALDVDMDTVYMYDGTTNEELGKTSIDSIGTWIINDNQ